MAKLTAAKINKLNREFDKKKKIYILADNDEVDISVKFKESTINEIVMEYLEVIGKLSQVDNLDNKKVMGTLGVLNLLILREFSNVPMIPKDTSNIYDTIDITLALLDCGVMEAVIKEFDEVEIKKVYDKLEEMGKAMSNPLVEAAIKSALNSNKQVQENTEVDSDEL